MKQTSGASAVPVHPVEAPGIPVVKTISLIGFKKLLEKLDKTDLCSEFSDQEHSSVRRKIAAIEIYFDLLIAFQRNGV